MKIRNGFVSNSSSSSFICKICGHDESGYDMCLSEAEMYECENGHTFCTSHVINMSDKEKCIEILKQCILDNNDQKEIDLLNTIENLTDEDFDYDGILDEYDSEYNLDDHYDIPAKFCPICQMEHILDEDLVLFMIKKFDVKFEDLKAEIKSKFPTYNNFTEYIYAK